jgi:hypothetical protein
MKATEVSVVVSTALTVCKVPRHFILCRNSPSKYSSTSIVPQFRTQAVLTALDSISQTLLKYRLERDAAVLSLGFIFLC